MEKSKIRRSIPWVFFSIIGLLVAIVIIFVVLQSPQNLYPEEIRSYEGEDLSSVANLQENAIRGNQRINQTAYRLSITGLVDNPLQLSYDQIINNHQHYQKVITLYCVEGWNAKILWEGILISDLIAEAGVQPQGKVAIFRAADGYSTMLPLDYLSERNILLSYKVNGIILPPEKGFPFQLAAESQAGYKWIKWLTEIEISDDENYRGYWESRGFPNDATIE
jgi:DMSO/TMAO reductase YedYZ molybdopterin-dependent catalytic subunit